MGTGIGPMDLVVFLVYLVPLAAGVFLILLGFRFVRSMERIADAMERIAQRDIRNAP